jgi:hypothetical protein
MPFFQLLMTIIAALGPILQGPYAQKILLCVITNYSKGIPAVLACIATAAPVTADEQKAHAHIETFLKSHIAANP